MSSSLPQPHVEKMAYSGWWEWAQSNPTLSHGDLGNLHEAQFLGGITFSFRQPSGRNPPQPQHALYARCCPRAALQRTGDWLVNELLLRKGNTHTTHPSRGSWPADVTLGHICFVPKWADKAMRLQTDHGSDPVLR